MDVGVVAGWSALAAAAGTVVGYLLVGALGLGGRMPAPLVVLAMAAGTGFVAIRFGFWRGNDRHPASVVGGLVLLVASTIFLAGVGLSLLASEALAA